MYLINLETSGNQAYIFASNKLPNIVGASELLYRVGTSYVERALKTVSGRDFTVENITHETHIEEENSPEFEVVIATSGKALLLAKDRDKAKEFIKEWSSIIVDEAPGVDALAVCSKSSFDVSDGIDEYLKVFKETEREMTMLRIREGSSLARFQRIPVVAECAFSGLPASFMKDGQPVSEKSNVQRAASKDGDIRKRMRALFPGNASEEILNGLDSLKKSDWLAVIHADGNGLGQLFINFADHVKNIVGKNATGRHYIDYYRNFSSALDNISWQAFNKTVHDIWRRKDDPPVVPIVVGGDDLTVVIDGYESLRFAECFMRNFCEATQDVFEMRCFNENFELRWVRNSHNIGEAVILTESQTLQNMEMESIGEFHKRSSQYLLWGTAKEIDGKICLFEHRVGKIEIPLNLEQGEKVSLNFDEFFSPDPDHGNMIWRFERLKGLGTCI